MIPPSETVADLVFRIREADIDESHDFADLSEDAVVALGKLEELVQRYGRRYSCDYDTGTGQNCGECQQCLSVHEFFLKRANEGLRDELSRHRKAAAKTIRAMAGALDRCQAKSRREGDALLRIKEEAGASWIADIADEALTADQTRGPVSYIPPSSREEAIDEIMETGYTVSSMLAVALAFPLFPREIEEIAEMHKRADLSYYLDEACTYLNAWGKGACQL